MKNDSKRFSDLPKQKMTNHWEAILSATHYNATFPLKLLPKGMRLSSLHFSGDEFNWKFAFKEMVPQPRKLKG